MNTVKRGSRYETTPLDGARLRSFRLERRLSQARLAELAAPVSRGHISMIETRSRTQVSRDLAERLASTLGVSLNDLSPLSPIAAANRQSRPVVNTSRMGHRQGTRIADTLSEVKNTLAAIAETLNDMERMLARIVEGAEHDQETSNEPGRSQGKL